MIDDHERKCLEWTSESRIRGCIVDLSSSTLLEVLGYRKG
jgi:hypothetical protein